jgi:hypothetical protein
MTRIVTVLSMVLITGCSPPLLRGSFTLLSTEDLSGKYELLSDQKLTGRACFSIFKAAVFADDAVFDEAVRTALAGQPEGTVLVHVEFVDEGSCVNVTGLPAKLN